MQKTVFITGGASGIGAACVRKFLAEGFKVAFTDMNEQRGNAGQPEEVAELVYFLMSDKASFCTGGHYLCDGGLCAR